VERSSFRAPAHVHANLWAFLVVIVSIFIDYSRSRSLMRVQRSMRAKLWKQTPCNLLTDIWSSRSCFSDCWVSWRHTELEIAWLAQADAVGRARCGRSGGVDQLQLGRRAVDELLDSVPPDLGRHIADAAKVADVREVKQGACAAAGPDFS